MENERFFHRRINVNTINFFQDTNELLNFTIYIEPLSVGDYFLNPRFLINNLKNRYL